MCNASEVRPNYSTVIAFWLVGVVPDILSTALNPVGTEIVRNVSQYASEITRRLTDWILSWSQQSVDVSSDLSSLAR